MANSIFVWPGMFSFNGSGIVFLNPILLPDGTAAAPSLTFASQTDEGLYKVGASVVGLSIGGAAAFQFASGQLLILSNTASFTLGAANDLSIVRAGAALVNITNSASAGFGLDGATDAVMKVRTRAQTGYATVDALGYKIAGNAFGSGTVAPSSPTGTTSTTLVMAGLAGAITTRTGNIVISMSGYLTDNTANDGTKCQISYGTGTAPVNGAALTGTQVGPIVQYNASTLAAGASAPYAATWVVTGLTVNTAYWFDTAFAAITGGTGSLVQASMIAYDIP